MPTSTIETEHSVPDQLTIFLTVSPTIGLDRTHRDIRAEFDSMLAGLDAELAALGIQIAPTEPVALDRPRKRRWRR